MSHNSNEQTRSLNIANNRRLSAQGVDVDEWNKASKGMKLPETAKTANAWDQLTASQMMDSILEHPASQIMARGLLGAGVGGGLGAMAGGIHGLVSTPDEGESRIGNAVTNAQQLGMRTALLGGALGGGRAVLDTGIPAMMGASQDPALDNARALLARVRAKTSSAPVSLDDIMGNDVVPMHTTTGALADYFAPGTWGGERAGRSQTLANAAGVHPSFRVRHPTIAAMGAMGLGGLAGAGIGAAGGAVVGDIMDSRADMLEAANTGLDGGYSEDHVNAIPGAMIGGGLGGLAGMLAGPLLSAYLRRRDMAGINNAFDAGHGEPDVPELSRASMLLLPDRGPHRKGQIDAYRYLTGDSEDVRNNALLNDAGYVTPLLSGAVPGLGQAVSIGHRYGQNFATQNWSESLANNRDRKVMQDLSGMKAAGWEDIKNQIASMSSQAAGAVQSAGGNASETLQRMASGAGSALLPWKERALIAAKRLASSAMVQGQFAKQKIQEGLSDPNRRYLYAAALGAGGAGLAATAAEMTNRRPHKRILSSLLGGAGAGALLAGSGLYAADHLKMTGYKPGVGVGGAGAEAALSSGALAAPVVDLKTKAVNDLTERVNSLPLDQRAAEIQRLKEMTNPTTTEQLYNGMTSAPLTSAAAVGTAGYAGAAGMNRFVQGRELNQMMPGGRGMQNSLAFQLPDAEIAKLLKARITASMPHIDAGSLDTFLARPEVAHAMRFDPNALQGLAHAQRGMLPGSTTPNAAWELSRQLRNAGTSHMLGEYANTVNNAAAGTGFVPNTTGLMQRVRNAFTFKGPKATPWTPANSGAVANQIAARAARPRMLSRGLAGVAAIPVAMAGDAILKSVFSKGS